MRDWKDTLSLAGHAERSGACSMNIWLRRSRAMLFVFCFVPFVYLSRPVGQSRVSDAAKDSASRAIVAAGAATDAAPRAIVAAGAAKDSAPGAIVAASPAMDAANRAVNGINRAVNESRWAIDPPSVTPSNL